MSNPVREIKARMGAARVVLEGRTLSAATRASISKVQAIAVVDAIAKSAANLQPEMLVELCTFATSVPWEELDLERILDSLSSVGAQPSRKRRRVQQNFTSLMDFFTADDWTHLTTSTSKDGVLSAIIRKAWQLGLRTPSEPTLKAMNSAWAVLTENEVARARNLTSVRSCIFCFS